MEERKDVSAENAYDKKFRLFSMQSTSFILAQSILSTQAMSFYVRTLGFQFIAAFRESDEMPNLGKAQRIHRKSKRFCLRDRNAVLCIRVFLEARTFTYKLKNALSSTQQRDFFH